MTGHLNMAVNVARQLASSAEHRVIYLTNQETADKKLDKFLGTNVEIMIEPEPGIKIWQQLADNNYWLETGLLSNKLLNHEKAYLIFNELSSIDSFRSDNQLLDQVLAVVKPDLIVTDSCIVCPAIVKLGIPLIRIWITARLTGIGDRLLPPHGSGLPIDCKPEIYDEFKKKIIKPLNAIWKPYNTYLVSMGCQPLPENVLFPIDNCLNIYAYPKEMDQLYDQIKPLPKNVIRVDHMLIESDYDGQEFIIPDKLRDKSGKLIYFAMGSICASDRQNMIRLIKMLGKSQHRFIMSLGDRLDDYPLPDNVWGQPSLPQLSILPLVDLVITHCGINTICETMYFGKPMICLPVFGDQYDHSQRIHESGFGIRLDVHKCTERQLLGAIDCLLNDKVVTKGFRSQVI
ncbi:UDP-glucuronosyltransferase 1-6-like [Oppia nitens]|uniref:UDP-glucuronosyltransferase 1-6-like n=1 Tax=Oppia nitens TaxID=1686743 RepID=UPI0023DCC892|nr:UDP-glucuronosyltransferase 1-6-like [Oppia nitens]